MIDYTDKPRVWVAKKAAEGNKDAQAEMRRRGAIAGGRALHTAYRQETIKPKRKPSGIRCMI